MEEGTAGATEEGMEEATVQATEEAREAAKAEAATAERKAAQVAEGCTAPSPRQKEGCAPSVVCRCSCPRRR